MLSGLVAQADTAMRSRAARNILLLKVSMCSPIHAFFSNSRLVSILPPLSEKELLFPSLS